MSPGVDYKFGAVWVKTQPDAFWLATLFPDGVINEVRLTADRLDHYRILAADLGYGRRGNPADIWRCCFDTNVFYTLVSQSFGQEWSLTLWKTAHLVAGRPFPPGAFIPDKQQCAVESALVLNLQAYFNAAARPIPDVGHLAQAVGVPITHLKREFMQRIRAARADAREWQSLHVAPFNAAEA